MTLEVLTDVSSTHAHARTHTHTYYVCVFVCSAHGLPPTFGIYPQDKEAEFYSDEEDEEGGFRPEDIEPKKEK